MTPTRVLLLQRVLAHYRLPFFRRLATSEKLSMSYGYGREHRRASLKSVCSPVGLNVVPLANWHVGSRMAVFQAGVRRQLRSGKYDTVVAEFNPRIISNVLACFLAKRLNLPFVWWGHGIGPKTSAFGLRLRLRLIHSAGALICYGAAEAERLIEAGISREKVYVAPNSIDLDDIQKYRREQPQKARRSVLFVGRLIPKKKVDLLLRGFAKAVDRCEAGTTLVIIGDGPERANLEAEAEQLGISDRVEFTGEILDQEQIARRFNSAWLYVSPGYIGLAGIHSLAYGVPVLCADKEPHAPEIAALEDGVNSRFFSSDDADDLASQLGRLAKEDSQWQRMSTAARNSVDNRFGLDNMVDAFKRAIAFAVGSTDA